MESLNFCISLKIYYNKNGIIYSQIKQPQTPCMSTKVSLRKVVIKLYLLKPL
jgi:hypothetical protein